MISFKRIIKAMPLLYRILSPLYQALRHPITGCFERLTDYRGEYWQGLQDKDIRGYWDTRTDRNRNEYLVSILDRQEPESILEVGCNCGNKLYGLALAYPHARLSGIDINPRAVELGCQWLEEAGINNVKLAAGRAEDLSRFDDRCFDVVFSWAALIYPQPSQIRNILSNMTRIANKSIVLLEVQSSVPMSRARAAGAYFYGHWKRDYATLLKEVAPSFHKPTVESIPSAVWYPGGGGGAVIAARRLGSMGQDT